LETLLQAALFNAGWAAALALGAMVAGRAFRRRPALVHGLWLLVLLKLVTPSLVPAQFASGHAPEAPAIASAPPGPSIEMPRDAELSEASAVPDAIAPAMPSAAVPAPFEVPIPAAAPPTEGAAINDEPQPWPWAAALVAIWLAGTAAWGVTVVAQIARFRRLLRASRPAPEALRGRVDRLGALLRLRRGPAVWLVPAPIPPMLWAPIGPPRLLLPEELWGRLDEKQQDAVLMHELAHLKRRDHWVRRFEMLVLGLYWWNPVAWWARRRVEEAEEECCDAWVVWALPKAVDAYAEALVATAVFLSGSRALRPAGATGVGRVPPLKKRLSMILRDQTTGTMVRLAPRGALIIGGLCLLLLPGWAPGRSTDEPPGAAPADKPEGRAPSEAERRDEPGGAPPPAQEERPAPGSPATPRDAEQGVVVSQPLVREVNNYLGFNGRIEAAQTVEIRARVGGALTEVFASAGTMVKKGDLLFKIDDRVYQAEVEKAEAEVAGMEARLKGREAARALVRTLKDKAIVSAEEIVQAEGERDEAIAALGGAMASLKLAKLDLESTRIVAPIDGKIGRIRLSAGSLVVAGDTVLATLTSSGTMFVTFNVDEGTALKLDREWLGGSGKSDIPVQVILAGESDWSRHGRLDSVDTEVNPQTGTLRCRAIIEKSTGPAPIPGMSASVRLVLGKRPVMLIPDSAMQDSDSAVLLVLGDQGLVESRSVTPARRDDGSLRCIGKYVEVLVGLKEDDWVVVSGFDRAKVGAKVEAKKVALTAPSEPAP
jgi:RND family efflux transporter MFP subunit